MPKTKAEIKACLSEQQAKYVRLSAICEQEMFGFQNEDEGNLFFSPLGGRITTLNRPPSREKIAVMYFLSKGHTLDDLFSEDQAMLTEKRTAGDELKTLFQNNNIEPLKKAWLGMHEVWRTMCAIPEDLSNDEYLAQNYIKLHLMHSEIDLIQSAQSNKELMQEITDEWNKSKKLEDVSGETKKEQMDFMQRQVFEVYDAFVRRSNFILAKGSPYMAPSNNIEINDETLFQQAAAKQILCTHTANENMKNGPKGEKRYLVTHAQGEMLEESMNQMDEESRRVCKEKLKADALSELPVKNLVQYEYVYRKDHMGEIIKGTQGDDLCDRYVDFTDAFKDQMRDCGSKVQRIEDIMERLKTADHTFHINSSQFKEVLRSLEEVSRLSVKMAVDESSQELEKAYTRLGTACKAYLKGKTEDNRYTSLGKSRVTLVSELLSYQEKDLAALGLSDLEPVNQEPVHQQTEQNAVRKTSFSELNPLSGQTGKQRENQRVNTPNKAKEHTVSGMRK